MNNLDTTRIVAALAEFGRKISLGQESKKLKYVVDIELPEEIGLAIEAAADQMDTLSSALLSKLANEGLNYRFKQMVEQIKGPAVPQQPKAQSGDVMDQLKEAGFDVSKIVAGFGQLKQLVAQLEVAKQVLENDTENNTDGSPQRSNDTAEIKKDTD